MLPPPLSFQPQKRLASPEPEENKRPRPSPPLDQEEDLCRELNQSLGIPKLGIETPDPLLTGKVLPSTSTCGAAGDAPPAAPAPPEEVAEDPNNNKTKGN